MAYNNSNAGYNRRSGIRQGGGSAPAAGFTARFDAGYNVFSDVGGTTPSVNGGGVASWKARDGSAGVQLHVQSGAGLVYRTVFVNGLPAIEGGGVSLTKTQALRGTLAGSSGEGTVFIIAKWGSANDTSACGTNATYFAEQRSAPGLAKYVNPDIAHFAQIAGDFSGSWHCITSMATLVGPQIFIGKDDTRTASLTGGGAGADLPDGTDTEIFGGLTGRFLVAGSYVAEIIFYPTALAEADRITTEEYLADKYGITLPY